MARHGRSFSAGYRGDSAFYNLLVLNLFFSFIDKKNCNLVRHCQQKTTSEFYKYYYISELPIQKKSLSLSFMSIQIYLVESRSMHFNSKAKHKNSLWMLTAVFEFIMTCVGISKDSFSTFLSHIQQKNLVILRIYWGLPTVQEVPLSITHTIRHDNG